MQLIVGIVIVLTGMVMTCLYLDKVHKVELLIPSSILLCGLGITITSVKPESYSMEYIAGVLFLFHGMAILLMYETIIKLIRKHQCKELVQVAMCRVEKTVRNHKEDYYPFMTYEYKDQKYTNIVGLGGGMRLNHSLSLDGAIQIYVCEEQPKAYYCEKNCSYWNLGCFCLGIMLMLFIDVVFLLKLI